MWPFGVKKQNMAKAKKLSFIVDGEGSTDPTIVVRIPKPGKPPIYAPRKKVRMIKQEGTAWFGNVSVPHNVMFIMYEIGSSLNLLFIDSDTLVKLLNGKQLEHKLAKECDSEEESPVATTAPNNTSYEQRRFNPSYLEPIKEISPAERPTPRPRPRPVSPHPKMVRRYRAKRRRPSLVKKLWRGVKQILLM